MSQHSRWKKRTKVLLVCLLGLPVFLAFSLMVVMAVLPKPPLLSSVPFSKAVYDKQGTLLRLTLSKDGAYRLYTRLDQISDLCKELTLLHEDQYFYRHPGINPVSLVKAVWKSYVTHDFTMGASTITMQVARLRFGIHSRSVLGKLEQMFRALQLEFYYSKDQILEAYLNLASYGGNVEGVGAAARIYFHKHASQLTLKEALLLSVTPQNPAHRNPLLENQQDVDKRKQARVRLFWRFVSHHPKEISKAFILDAPLLVYRREDLPFLAPHFVDGILASLPENQPFVTTTLDVERQKKYESVIERYVQSHQHRGIKNAAALLIDASSMEIQAAVGSASFQNTAIEGQVNGTKAKRSPGSALKPFVYALALDQGLIHPMTLLKDTPKSFGAYNPENFDGHFLGPLHATEALNQSRNIPAVSLSAQLIHPSFYGFLKQAGISQMKEESFYGLSPVLGGLEVTMEELGMLYATIKNDGMLKPLRTKLHDPSLEGVRLLSKEASFIIEQMMQKNPRPKQHFLLQSALQKMPVAWKTGTSFAYRDAWSVALVGPYVLLVWVGNFDGQGNPEFTGRSAAAPLMFELIESLDFDEKKIESPEQKAQRFNITWVDVCENSGFLATSFCKHRIKTWFIPGVSPMMEDEINREIAIDKKTGLRSCRPENDEVLFETYEFWPSDLKQIFKQAGIPRRDPPPFRKECSLLAQMGEGKAPEITSPQKHVNYVYQTAQKGMPEQTLPLLANVDADVHHLYWFADHQFLGKSFGNKPLYFKLRPGSFTIRAIDDKGRSSAVVIKVEQSQK